MTAPAVSVVVPMYNLELYVERCLASLERQSLGDLEILVVDDGSTDDTPARIRDFTSRDRRFTCFTKPNGGHGSALNHGIERAAGRYLMFVDGDDWVEPDTCEVMLSSAEQTGADLVMGDLRYVFSDHSSRFRPIELGVDKVLDDAERRRLFKQWATPNARLYRRDLFADPAIRFLPGILFADVNFAPKSYLAAGRIAYLCRELYNYDLTRPTQSMTRTDRRILDVVPALRDLLELYRAKGQFRAYEAELMHYATRHVVSWLDRVKQLTDTPRQAALEQLFAVLDESFGEAWLGAPLADFASPRKAALIRQARRLGYRPILWAWQVREGLRLADDGIEWSLTLPARAYERTKGRLKRLVPGL